MKFIVNIKKERFIDYPVSDFKLSSYLKELLRPWKLLSFYIGIFFLFMGAMSQYWADWDLGISIIMGTLTYIFAPGCISFFISSVRYKPNYWQLGVIIPCIIMYLIVDTSYVIYHTWAGNQMYRVANFLGSTILFIVCGFVWLYRGTFKELNADLPNIEIHYD